MTLVNLVEILNRTRIFLRIHDNIDEYNYAISGFQSHSDEMDINLAQPLVDDDVENLHCGRNALTDSFGWFIQGILASLAFALLILKRFCEPRRYRRQWIIWFYDTSKQGIGAMVIHFTNVFLAGVFQGDPCTWYIVSFLLDSSAGLFIIFICIRSSQWIAKQKGWSAFNFGEYDKPQWKAWLGQCGIYVTIMVIEKVLITCLIHLDFWIIVNTFVRDILLSPLQNPKLELAIVVLVIPFVINAIMFWVVDNFLMRKRHKVKDDYGEGIIRRKVRYKKLERRQGPESEVLLAVDDENREVTTDMSTCSVHRHTVSSSTTAVT